MSTPNGYEMEEVTPKTVHETLKQYNMLWTSKGVLWRKGQFHRRKTGVQNSENLMKTIF